MVASTIQLPNIRKMFIPDPGNVILDCDFAQADARVVAWDSDCAGLKKIFNDPTKDLHDENAVTIFGEVNSSTRPKAKMGVHAVDYLITTKNLAKALRISLAEAQHFKNAWFTANPEIPQWHDRIENELETTRTIYNPFGYRKIYQGRLSSCLTEAVAWIPQSTVAIAINKALYNIYKTLPQVQILIQVHDSLVMQFPRRYFPEILPDIRKAMTIKIPYSDPLYLPVTAEASAISWGHKTEINWEGEFETLSKKVYAGF